MSLVAIVGTNLEIRSLPCRYAFMLARDEGGKRCDG